MDPCPFVRVLVGNLALRMPSTSSAAAPRTGASGVHPATTPCHCRVRLDKLPYQLATAPLLPATATTDSDQQNACNTGAFAAAFHLSRADLDRATAKPALFGGPRRVARLKLAVYAGKRRGATCGVGGGAGGRLLGKVVVPLDLKAAETKPVVFHSGWLSLAPRRRNNKPGGGKAAAHVHVTVRAEPDPRFAFEFDGEPECSPQVMQVRGAMRQPMFTCKFSCRSHADNLRSRSSLALHSDPGSSLSLSSTNSTGTGGGGPRAWLAKLGSDRERRDKRERKGWSVTVHDLSGSPVALASMVTPFVPSPGSDRVSRSNPGAWLILRPAPGDGTWQPWGRLECWRERQGGGGDCLGYRFELLVPDPTGMGVGVCVAESSVSSSKGGRFAIDLTAAQPFGVSPGSTPRGSGDWGGGLQHGAWPFGSFRGFVMAAAVQGEGRCSRPAVEVGVAHVGCAEDAAAFVALAAAVDLSMDACRLFSCKLRRELSASRADLLR